MRPLVRILLIFLLMVSSAVSMFADDYPTPKHPYSHADSVAIAEVKARMDSIFDNITTEPSINGNNTYSDD